MYVYRAAVERSIISISISQLNCKFEDSQSTLSVRECLTFRYFVFRSLSGFDFLKVRRARYKIGARLLRVVLVRCQSRPRRRTNSRCIFSFSDGAQPYFTTTRVVCTAVVGGCGQNDNKRNAKRAVVSTTFAQSVGVIGVGEPRTPVTSILPRRRKEKKNGIIFCL